MGRKFSLELPSTGLTSIVIPITLAFIFAAYRGSRSEIARASARIFLHDFQAVLVVAFGVHILTKQYHSGFYAVEEVNVKKDLKTLDDQMEDMANEYVKQMQLDVFEGEHGDKYERKNADELWEREFVNEHGTGDLSELRDAYEEHGENLYLGDMAAQETGGSYVGTPVY